MRVLYICGNILQRGGTEAFAMNYLRHMDLVKIKIDFAVQGYDKGAYDEEVSGYGCKIYHLPLKNKHYLQYKKQLKFIYASGNYEIVHAHMDSANGLVLKWAKECGVPHRISHSHNTKVMTQNPLKLVINKYFRILNNMNANYFFACSKNAGEWLYGKKKIDEGKVKIINNAIDVKKYAYSSEIREKLRRQYGIESRYIIGMVGRLHFQKNPLFMLDVINELRKENPDYLLIFVGDGTLEGDIEQRAKELRCENNIRLMGVCDNIYEWLSAFDIFCMPSIFEGLPIAGIEAQANGLVCLFSEHVPRTARLLQTTVFLPIDSDNPSVWADYIQNHIEDGRVDGAVEMLRKQGYDIEAESKTLQTFYESINAALEES